MTDDGQTRLGPRVMTVPGMLAEVEETTSLTAPSIDKPRSIETSHISNVIISSHATVELPEQKSAASTMTGKGDGVDTSDGSWQLTEIPTGPVDRVGF